MLNRDLIPLVAETINTRPRSLVLANAAQQLIIKNFRMLLSLKLKTAVEITFAAADARKGTLTIGYMPLEFRETALCQKAATDVIDALKVRLNTEAHIEATLAGIPNEGGLLLYDFEQAYNIARNLKLSDFSTIQFAYTACLHFAAVDRKDIDAEKWFEVLCEFATKCISNGAWRTALLCLDQAEHLLQHLFQIFSPEYQSPEELIEALSKLGDAFNFADLPERSINLAKKYLPRLEELDDGNTHSTNALDKLETKILGWQKASSELWSENAPLIIIGRDFAKKIA